MVTWKSKLDGRERLSMINGTFQTRLTAEEVGTRKASSSTVELAWVTRGFKRQGYFERQSQGISPNPLFLYGSSGCPNMNEPVPFALPSATLVRVTVKIAKAVLLSSSSLLSCRTHKGDNR